MNEFLPDEVVVIHNALTDANIPHAFGGAIALAYWGTPRYTHDVDINIALPADQHKTVLDTLSSIFPIHDREKAERELTHVAQTRLRWGALPVDLSAGSRMGGEKVDLNCQCACWGTASSGSLAARHRPAIRTPFQRP